MQLGTLLLRDAEKGRQPDSVGDAFFCLKDTSSQVHTLSTRKKNHSEDKKYVSNFDNSR